MDQSELELRANSMLQTLAAQRNSYADDVVNAIAENAVLKARIAALMPAPQPAAPAEQIAEPQKAD